MENSNETASRGKYLFAAFLAPIYLGIYALIGISSTTTGVLLYINPLIAFTLAATHF